VNRSAEQPPLGAPRENRHSSMDADHATFGELPTDLYRHSHAYTGSVTPHPLTWHSLPYARGRRVITYSHGNILLHSTPYYLHSDQSATNTN
jgi:hypothetical protein